MNDELKGVSDKLQCLSDKIDEMRQDYTRGRYENLGFIFWAFSIAVLGTYFAIPHPFLLVAAIAIGILGCRLFAYSRRVKTNQDGGKHIWIRLARWFEWVFATVLMTAITVIVSLQYLSGYARWLLLIGLFIFLVATLISQFDQAGWFGRRGGGKEEGQIPTLHNQLWGKVKEAELCLLTAFQEVIVQDVLA